MPKVPELTNINAMQGYAGLAPEAYNPADVPLETYQLMRKRDPIVRFAYWHVTRSVRRRIGDYSHDNPRVEDYVRRQVLPAAMRDLARLQKAIYFGVALAQPRYVLDGGELRLAELVACPMSRFWHGRGFRRDEAGQVDAVDINGLGWLPFVHESGARQLFHYATGDDDGSPWGHPAARLAYTAWYIKHRLTPFEAIGLERHGVGTAIFKVADDTPDADGGTAPSEAYVNAWSQMGSASALAIDKEDELTIVTPGWQVNSPYDPVIRRLDGYIFNSFSMPYLIAAEANFGTRAQAGVALETYIMAETDIAEDLADAALLNQVIGSTVALQFGPNTEPGDLTIRDPAPPDLQEWSNILTQLDATGAFNAEIDEQLQFVGERFGLPVDELMAYYQGGGVPGSARQRGEPV